MAHYYDSDVTVNSKPERLLYRFQDHTITLISDNGVFSKSRVDYGSDVLLNAVEVGEAQSLLDVGCGYGPIGLSLKAVHPQLQVSMVDVNRRALDLAKQAAELNNLTADIHESDCYEEVEGTYDLILSNPPVRAGKKVVSTILTGAKDHLNTGGRLVIVLQKKQGAPSAKKLMADTYGNVEVLARDKGYYILQSTLTD